MKRLSKIYFVIILMLGSIFFSGNNIASLTEPAVPAPTALAVPFED